MFNEGQRGQIGNEEDGDLATRASGRQISWLWLYWRRESFLAAAWRRNIGGGGGGGSCVRRRRRQLCLRLDDRVLGSGLEKKWLREVEEEAAPASERQRSWLRLGEETAEEVEEAEEAAARGGGGGCARRRRRRLHVRSWLRLGEEMAEEEEADVACVLGCGLEKKWRRRWRRWRRRRRRLRESEEEAVVRAFLVAAWRRNGGGRGGGCSVCSWLQLGEKMARRRRRTWLYWRRND